MVTPDTLSFVYDFTVFTGSGHRINANCDGVTAKSAAALRDEKGETVLIVGNLEPFSIRFAHGVNDARQ